MIGYATHGYLTIACIFQMVSSTLCGSLLITFSSHNICQLHLLSIDPKTKVLKGVEVSWDCKWAARSNSSSM